MSDFLTKSDEQRYTLGVVYEPDVLDTDNEFAKAEDIERAAWEYMHRLQVIAGQGADVVKAIKTAPMYEEAAEIDITELEKALRLDNPLDDQHLQVSKNLGTVVESFIAPCDMTIGDQQVKKGSWLLGVVWTPEMFEKIKKGERTGLSLYGRARRVKI